jgi:hypothetical protein
LNFNFLFDFILQFINHPNNITHHLNFNFKIHLIFYHYYYFLDNLNFKTTTLISPRNYRKILNHKRPLDGMLVCAEPKKKEHINYARNYERKLFNTNFSSNLIENLFLISQSKSIFFLLFKKNFFFYILLKMKLFFLLMSFRAFSLVS